jgi:hypothetical protein
MFYNMRVTLLSGIVFLLIHTQMVKSQDFMWVRNFGSPSVDISPSKSVMDAAGNIYILGHFSGTADFMPGLSVFYLDSEGLTDVFIAKMNAKGGLVWAKRIGGPGIDQGHSLVLDSLDNVYITGCFTGKVDFDPGPDTFYLTGLPETENNTFISRLDTNGDFVWAKSIDGAHRYLELGGNAIAIDGSGNIYMYTQLIEERRFGADSFTVQSTNLYVSKLDAGGDFFWTKKIGRSGNNGNSKTYLYASDLAVDVSGNIYISGISVGAVALGPDLDGCGTKCQRNGFFISQWNTDGDFMWVNDSVHPNPFYKSAIAVDASGNIYMGVSAPMLWWDTNPYYPVAGKNRIFITKWDLSGSLIWIKNIEGRKSASLEALVADAMGNIYIAGSFNGYVDFDPGPGYFYLEEEKENAVTGFLSKLDPNGNFVLAKKIGIDSIYQASALGGLSGVYSLMLDPSMNIYLTGSFCGKVDFDPGPGKHSLVSSYGGLRPETYLLKLSSYHHSVSNIETALCQGNFLSPSRKYTWDVPGIYTDTIPNARGYDSIITIQLRTNKTFSYMHRMECDLDYYVSPSGKYTWISSGIYYDTLVNNIGCDSIVRVQLGLFPPSSGKKNIQSCHSYKSPSGKYIWTSSGIYYDTLISSTGCVSPVTIDLEILKHSTSSFSTQACHEYVSPSGKYTWTSSGVYLDTLINGVGCDSILTIDLEILKISFSQHTAITCGQHISPSGKYTWTSSGTYYDTLVNDAGCDSILMLKLTFRPYAYGYISQFACDSYISPSGKYIWTSSGTYYDTLINDTGCDSVLMISVTINSFSSVGITFCGTHVVSPSGKYTWTSSGIYYDTLTDRRGCDSVIRTHLTLNSLPDVSITQNGKVLKVNEEDARYKWLLCRNNYYVEILWETGQEYEPADNGSYAVVVTKNRCIDTSSCYEYKAENVSVRGFDDGLFDYRVYPNPSGGLVTVKVSENAELRLYTVSGKMVYQSEVRPFSRHDFSALANGLYYVQLSNSRGSVMEKIVILR